MKSIMIPAAVLLLITSVIPVYSQSTASVSYAEGTSFQLVRNSESTSYSVSRDDVIGMPLFPEDSILTDPGCFIEVLIESGNGAVVKITENTSFTVTSLDGIGGGVFRVSLGRIRVKVASLLGNSRFWVTGYDTVAGVRGTDFGYDIFYDNQTTVYCFDGEVEVLQFDKETVSKIDLMGMDPLLLTAGKMVTADSSRPDQKLKPRNITDDMLSYWAAHPIITALGEAPEISGELNLAPTPDSRKYTYETGGKIVFAMGVGMMTLGGLLKAFLPTNDTAGNLSMAMLAMGGTSVVAGGGMMIYSINLP